MYKFCPENCNYRNGQRNSKSCGKYGCLRVGECLQGTNAYYGHGKSGHIVRDFPQVMNQDRFDALPRPNPIVAAYPPKRNRFYAFKSREENEKSADVVIGTLHVFSFSCMHY